MLRLGFTTNEPRSAPLRSELHQLVAVPVDVDFDQIDRFTKLAAAVLSYKRPRSEWWGNYQMHPLVQRRRRRVLQAALRPYLAELDALLMWGSWFHPFKTSGVRLPFFTYIDQSRSRTPVLDEPPTSERGRRRSHRLQAETYADCSGVLCWSQWARAQTLEAHDVDPENVHVVGWGPCSLDLSSEQIAPERREPIILHVSNDFHRKGVDFLLATAQRVAHAEPSARFLVVGEDPRMDVRDTDNVQFIGPLHDPGALADLFRRSSVFFLPHRFDRSPHVLVEAMSAALPLVTSSQGGPAELVAGGTGFARPIGDIGGYTEAIVSLLRNPELRAEMGSRSRALMLQKYNWPCVAKKIVHIIMNSFTGQETFRERAS
jgi:glycosyltransferase involved in cell wall biosynthesis